MMYGMRRHSDLALIIGVFFFLSFLLPNILESAEEPLFGVDSKLEPGMESEAPVIEKEEVVMTHEEESNRFLEGIIWLIVFILTMIGVFKLKDKLLKQKKK